MVHNEEEVHWHLDMGWQNRGAKASSRGSSTTSSAVAILERSRDSGVGHWGRVVVLEPGLGVAGAAVVFTAGCAARPLGLQNVGAGEFVEAGGPPDLEVSWIYFRTHGNSMNNSCLNSAIDIPTTGRAMSLSNVDGTFV
ncbi:hypothetical protein CERSUDRAFT_79704 [Gelatoporia subvermispora B]|uniref:Uncharacterized protein n=1 Tax=Ceriporiopsis subvermispora (strain B) TaxID=914234 RepID=M2RT37_CERS8|nr:hypothetical protein CERSUDRAFT_79704 [Gelatoporia subvermispora B]